VNFILQKRLPFLYGFFHLHKIFYTLHLDITSHISMIALMELILYQFIESSGTDTYHLVFR
ncbi:hypothetical protein P6Z51_13160, partial [Enterococcus faecium]|nr:hypothetical protein [Enterococcus faecium]